jgi:hypothetical protein
VPPPFWVWSCAEVVGKSMGGSGHSRLACLIQRNGWSEVLIHNVESSV